MNPDLNTHFPGLHVFGVEPQRQREESDAPRSSFTSTPEEASFLSLQALEHIFKGLQQASGHFEIIWALLKDLRILWGTAKEEPQTSPRAKREKALDSGEILLLAAWAQKLPFKTRLLSCCFRLIGIKISQHCFELRSPWPSGSFTEESPCSLDQNHNLKRYCYDSDPCGKTPQDLSNPPFIYSPAFSFSITIDILGGLCDHYNVEPFFLVVRQCNI